MTYRPGLRLIYRRNRIYHLISASAQKVCTRRAPYSGSGRRPDQAAWTMVGPERHWIATNDSDRQ